MGINWTEKQNLPMIYISLLFLVIAFGILAVFGEVSVDGLDFLGFVLVVFLLIILIVLKYSLSKRRQKLIRSGIFEIDEMDGKEFEKYLELFFKKQGYKAERTPYSGDYGADIILTDNNGKRTAIQAKRYSKNVGNRAVQEIVAAKNHYHCQDAIVITNSRYTKGAVSLAESNGVGLWDRDILVEMILESQTEEK